MSCTAAGIVTESDQAALKSNSADSKAYVTCTTEAATHTETSQIIASLTRESLTDRESEISNLPWTQTEENNALAKCRLGLRGWRIRKPMLYLHAVTDEDGHLLENEDESGRRLCEYWRTIFSGTH